MKRMENKEIIVHTRKEFIKLFKEIFIPNEYRYRKEHAEKFNREILPWDFSDNVGKAMNSWTSFWIYDDVIRISVQLEE